MVREKVLYLCIVCLVFQISVHAQLSDKEGGDGYDNYASEVLQNMTLSDKVALLLLPSQNDYYTFSPEKLPYSQNLLLSNQWLINGIEGFATGEVDVPFPDIRAISHLEDEATLEILRNDLLHFAAQEGYKAVVASNHYLFSGTGINYIDEPKDDRDFTLWFLGNQREDNLPVFEMPADLFSKNIPLRKISFNSGSSQSVQPWVLHQDKKKPENFEDLLSYGGVFLADNPEREHARILRAFQSNMLQEDDLNRACERLLTKINEAGIRLPDVNRIPEGVRMFARRRTFEEGLHYFSEHREPFFPANLSTINIELIADVEDQKAEAFAQMVDFHLPNFETSSQPGDYLLWLFDGENLTDSILADRMSEIRQGHPNSGIALFLADAGSYFQNHPLPYGIDALFTGSSDWPLVWEYLGQAAFSGVPLKKSVRREECFSGVRHLSRELPKTRLKIGIPEEVALHRDSLNKIDELIAEAIQTKATPGAQVLIARDGIVVWNKSYGYHTYQKKYPVKTNDIYDLASVTKVTATVPSLMKLYEEQAWALKDSLGRFFVESDTTEKSGITIKDLLLHESGLPSFIPFYLNTIDKDRLNGNVFGRRYSWKYNIKLDNYIYLNRTVSYRRDVFHSKADSVFSIPVAENMFMNTGYLDSIMHQVLEAPMRTRHNYLYSDLGFYFLGQLIPKLSGHSLNYFSRMHFYNPIGMYNTSFLPSMVFSRNKIVPTEDDRAFRKQLLDGWVHDPGAAMMGGVAGHAGLFSNSLDLAKLMQLYLNGGTYGGKRYLEDSVLEMFTGTYNDENRRGLGFDKPQPDTTKVSPASYYASPASFGHSGFTGTLVWADPETRLIYIFLSNRIHPNQYNKKLIEENYRTRLQDIAYRAIISSSREE
ncbi:beta-N-acetylhexosaminidase [Marinilabilia rubra]|uniref:Beta-N-acetylhexosaminidase n=2 Tax=Marinilabilia rubra TaxID=2162893 RepID=A0A2U2BCY0_9BACT|nr:beta-N-acetylhexosaminidase [Marinilabilia rubra]